jgi:hypothetical protein
VANPLYATPTKDDPVLFGDLFIADFLFDAWLEEDAAKLGALRVRGGHTAYATHAAIAGENHLLAHGEVPVAAMLVNDDCYAARVFERKESSRLQFVPVFALDPDEITRERQLSSADYTLFPLRPDPLFQGGIAYLNCPFGFNVPGEAARDRLRKKRVAQLSEKLAYQLEHRFGAHSVRRGMLVASTTRKKLEVLLAAAPTHKAAAKSVSKFLSTTWAIEGGIVDRVDSAAEDGEAPDALLNQLTQWVDQVARAATDARDALSALAINNAP